MNATALAAWLAIPQEDRDGVVALLRTRADVGAASALIAEVASAKSTAVARRIVYQASRDAERVNRACAAAADLLASVEPGAAEPQIDLAAPVEALGLSRRALAGLAALEIETVRGLTLHDAATLLRVRGFGLGCLQEVETALAAHGLRLARGAS